MRAYLGPNLFLLLINKFLFDEVSLQGHGKKRKGREAEEGKEEEEGLEIGKRKMLLDRRSGNFGQDNKLYTITTVPITVSARGSDFNISYF